MYIFVIITVLAVAFGTSAITFRTEADQIDRYYKQNTADNARNFASMVDGSFLAKLRTVAESDEYQAIRDQAEKDDDEQVIEDYLEEKGLWEQYSETRKQLDSYLEKMKGIKYLYIVAHGDANAEYDMYLIDDSENPLYETGYYEKRETELLGKDLTQLPEPAISNGDWGWLCSYFVPVYSAEGKAVCLVGCDIGMDDVMAERHKLLLYLFGGALALTLLVLVAAVLFVNRAVVNPLNKMTREMQKFNPSENLSYEDAGVIDIDIRSNDEIGDIYQGIRGMQIRIIDYLKDLFNLEQDKKKAEHDLKDKDQQIDQLNIKSYRDALTGVGNKAAYINKTEELDRQLKESDLTYAIVMVDINNLKHINDEYGHESGDEYIKGCCHLVCEAFKHSPVFRIGGDEFVAILQNADYENRKACCDQLRAEYENAYEQTDAEPWHRYSAAVGVAESTPDDRSTEPVFNRADKAMYSDKEQFKRRYGIDTR